MRRDWKEIIRGHLAYIERTVNGQGTLVTPCILYADPSGGTSREIAKLAASANSVPLDETPGPGAVPILMVVTHLHNVRAWLPERYRGRLDRFIREAPTPAWLWAACFEGETEYYLAIANPNPGYSAN